MKTRIFTLVLLNFILSLTLYAQPDKGTLMLKGNGTLSYTNYTVSTETKTLLNPKVGFSLFHNLVFGSEFYWNRIKIKDPISEATQNVYGISPFVKYYIFKNKAGPFLEYGANFLWSKSGSFGQDFTFKENYIRPGFAYFLFPNVSVETYLTIPFKSEGIRYNFNEFQPNEIALHFEMNYFLTGQKNHNPEDIFPAFIQKGSRSFGLSGHWNFDHFFMLNRVSVQSFIKEKHRLSHHFQLFFSPKTENSSLFSLWDYSIEYQPFVEIHKRTFFIPITGLTLVPVVSGRDVEVRFFGQAYIRPTLTHFLKRAILSTGFEYMTPYLIYFEKEAGFRESWGGNFIFSFELFVQQNLSLKGELYYNIFGNTGRLLSVFEDVLPPTYFEIGFNYFLNPKETHMSKPNQHILSD